MTFIEFKTLVKVLLIGDTKLPTSDTDILALVDMDSYRIAMEAEVLGLMTQTVDNTIVRKSGKAEWFIRKPILPHSDTSAIDLDTELVYALANYVAGDLSKQRSAYLHTEATRMVTAYNTKVYDVLYDLEFDPKTARLQL